VIQNFLANPFAIFLLLSDSTESVRSSGIAESFKCTPRLKN